MAEQIVELGPGESKTISFEVTPQVAKNYQVSVDGLTGSFRATEAPVEIAFDLTKPTVTPETIAPGTAITITCPITSRCSGPQTITAKVIIYEGSIMPGHGAVIATKTSSAFSISPGQAYNVDVHHTAVAGTIDRRDIEVEVYIAGTLVKESEWDDVYYVEKPILPEFKTPTFIRENNVPPGQFIMCTGYIIGEAAITEELSEALGLGGFYVGKIVPNIKTRWSFGFSGLTYAYVGIDSKPGKPSAHLATVCPGGGQFVCDSYIIGGTRNANPGSLFGFQLPPPGIFTNQWMEIEAGRAKGVYIGQGSSWAAKPPYTAEVSGRFLDEDDIIREFQRFWALR